MVRNNFYMIIDGIYKRVRNHHKLKVGIMWKCKVLAGIR